MDRAAGGARSMNIGAGIAVAAIWVAAAVMAVAVPGDAVVFVVAAALATGALAA